MPIAVLSFYVQQQVPQHICGERMLRVGGVS
jgi:hypothetical protein